MELTREEYESFLTGEIDRWEHSLTLADFIAAFRSGELDDSDPEVARLASLIGLGQNEELTDGFAEVTFGRKA